MRTSVLGQTTAYCSGADEKHFLKGSKEMLGQVAYGSRQVTLHSLVDSRLKLELFTQYHSVLYDLFQAVFCDILYLYFSFVNMIS